MLDNKDGVTKAKHELILKAREILNINGIKETVSFDEEEINLKTLCGNLTVEGTNLHINILNVDVGEAQITGKINSIYYSDLQENDKHSLLSKIFK